MASKKLNLSQSLKNTLPHNGTWIDYPTGTHQELVEVKNDLEWALNTLKDSDAELSVYDDEIITDLRQRWFSGEPWRAPKKKHKSQALKQIRREINGLKKLPPGKSFALFLADFKAARDQ